MANYGLQYLQVAKYSNEGTTVTYSEKAAAHGAVNIGLKLKSVEGKLYADDKLFDTVKEITGGEITVETAGLPEAMKQLLYGAKPGSREVPAIMGKSPVASTVYSTNDTGAYVGMSFVTKDRVEGQTVYVAVFVPKAIFSPPDTEFKTKGENLELRTETTVGQLLADDTTQSRVYEMAPCTTLEDAKAWCDAVLTSAP